MGLDSYFKNGKFYIWKESFAIVKSRKTYEGAFANIKDKDEVTVIIEQDKVKEKDVIKIEKGYKIITIDIIFPQNVVGVTAKISKALADKNIAIMPIAAYSRDHFLIKEDKIEKAISVFEGIGLRRKEL